MLPLLIGGIIAAAIISELTTKKPADKGEIVEPPKAPANEPPIDTGNDPSSDGGGALGPDPQNPPQERLNDNGNA